MAGEDCPSPSFEVIMLDPKLTQTKNNVELTFCTFWGQDKRYYFLLNKGEEARISYTAVSDILIYKAQVKAIWKDYLELFISGGKTIRALYDGEFQYGQEIYAIEYFPIKNEKYKWVASTFVPDDVRCISVNCDIYNGTLVRRYQINPFTGYIKVL